jgi:hypothetical protein
MLRNFSISNRSGDSLNVSARCPPPDDGFFDQSENFFGGIGEDNWMEEWTSFLQDSDIR